MGFFSHLFERKNKRNTEGNKAEADINCFNKEQLTGKWSEFVTNLCVDGNKEGNLPPQLGLCYQKASMAETALKVITKEVNAFLSQKPKLIKFSRGGKGAAIFYVKEGKSIINIMDIIFSAEYGKENLYLTSCFAVDIPEEDKEKLVNQYGDEEAISVGNVFMF